NALRYFDMAYSFVALRVLRDTYRARRRPVSLLAVKSNLIFSREFLTGYLRGAAFRRGAGRATALMVQSAMLENIPRKTGDTRERLLELAESAVLAKGFAATSIDELIAAAGISKSGFFYHFKDKGELAIGLLLRYLEQDRQLLEDIFRRGDDLNEDPLHG